MSNARHSATAKALFVDIHGAWQLYIHHPVPVGSCAIGTVTRGVATGALVRLPSGLLVQVNAGCYSVLDQSKAEAALRASYATRP